MRLSSITCCTISALLGTGVAAQASDGIDEHHPKDTDLNQPPDLNFSHPGEKFQVSAATIPPVARQIVPPESSHAAGYGLERRSPPLPVKIAAIAPAESDEVPAPIARSKRNWVAVKDLRTVQYQTPTATSEATADLQGETILAQGNPPPEQEPEIQIFVGQEQIFSVVSVNGIELEQTPVFSPYVTNITAAKTKPTAIAPTQPTQNTEVTSGDVNFATDNNDDYLVSQNSTNTLDCESCTPIEPLVLPEVNQGISPALSINIPVGFGADQNTIFLSSTYQAVTRTDGYSTFHSGIGIGLGNASKNVGLELSYSQDTNDDFFDGGFNAKLHKRFTPDFAGSIGWNGFLNTSRHDFEHSLYGALTKVFRTRESLNQPFSRVAVTAGIGSNQFRSDAAVRAGNNDVNVFGNIVVRVAKPISFITEWTGQDLGIGLSIAPFENIPLVITPAIRDVFEDTGSRFVLGIGIAKKF